MHKFATKISLHNTFSTKSLYTSIRAISVSSTTILEIIGTSAKESNAQGVCRLVESYEKYGHLKASTNPLKTSNNSIIKAMEKLNPLNYGLKDDDSININGNSYIVGEIVRELEKIYCGQITFESSYITHDLEKQWLFKSFSKNLNSKVLSEEKKEILKVLQDSQNLDNFIATKFGSVKRYGSEGAESLSVFNKEVFRYSSKLGCRQVIVAMPHRGRNNLLYGQLNLPAEVLFRKMKGLSEFPEEALTIATGDVLSHLTSSCQLEHCDNLHVTMLPNPSHLEAVNSVAMGKCRARIQSLSGSNLVVNQNESKQKVMCLIMHGDAAVMGQGIVAEAFNMAQLDGFDIGGTVHLIVNNQLGFTTTSELGRSSMYSSDYGKIINCPVIHVNGDSPEHVLKAARIAVEYRQKFLKDIIVDLICFRRWGHNELDDPSFTQPIMYNEINSKLSVPDAYAKQLIEKEILTLEELNSWKQEHTAKLNKSLQNVDDFKVEPIYLSSKSAWGTMTIPKNSSNSKWDSGYNLESLHYIGCKSVDLPNNIKMHERLEKFHASSRLSKLKEGKSLDWATAETLALGSLLDQGYNVRLCGQDVGRGTFSHRHAMLTCQESENKYIPLNYLKEDQQGFIEVINSPLSEEAILAFEYGMSIEHPNRLVIWEAQFGDFFNPAQVIIDTFITSGEAKWMQQSGLVMLLPHGYDGAGPEHSSCKIERFLQLTNSDEQTPDSDAVNISVCNPTTPAQYFHLLRRQMVRNFRKPLIVISPKTLLRLPAAVSSLNDMKPGTHFKSVISEDKIKDPKKKNLQLTDTAIVRLEELCPFPSQELQEVLKSFPEAENFVWSQEEPRNMGAWSFINTRFTEQVGCKLKYAGRPTLAATAVAIKSLHTSEFEQLMSKTFN